MNASVEWLSAFVDSGRSPSELRDLLTARVATVDAIESVRGDLAAIVVGQVVSAERHPDSDHLWVTKVDAGGEELLDVVCGAPNVAVGVRYPFAPVGTVMPNGMKIERRKIRGQLSNGMLCSSRELVLGQDHEGILPLTTEAKPGTPLLQALPDLGDTRLVIDVLPNRPDLLSHLGVAREIAAATQRPLTNPHAALEAITVPAPLRTTSHGSTDGVKVTVERASDAPAYLGVVVRGVKVGPSPAWLSSRLSAVGVRSINNVVDVTNYMLHGYGQPIHAFDLARLSGPEIRVRRAQAGERIHTLDGVDRVLDAETVVIADANAAQAIAGVIGGAGSEVTESTTDVFLELATFDARRVRATRRAQGVSTDASYHFERWVPASSPEETYETAVRLILSIAGGTVVEAPVLLAGPQLSPIEIALRTSRVARVLGVPVSAETCATLLASVGFASTHTQNALLVAVPAHRSDVLREIDLIEEVARLHGYDRIPDTLRPFRAGTVPDDPLVEMTQRVRATLVGQGFLELRPMPFVSATEKAAHRVVNPLAEHEAALRRDLLSTLARRAEFNIAHMQGNLRLFEVGTAFAPPVRGARPVETVRVAALAMGARRPAHFTEPDPPVWDAWDAKWLGELVARTAFPGSIIDVALASRTPVVVPAVPFSPPAVAFPSAAGQSGDVLWDIKMNGRLVGSIGRVPLELAAAHKWTSPAFGIEVTLQAVRADDVAGPGRNAYEGVRKGGAVAPARFAPQYKAVPALPAAWVDVTLLVPDTVSAAAVERGFRNAGDPLLEAVELVSEYRGKAIETGHRSLTWRLTFRHPERTLVEKQVEARRDKLLRALEANLGVRQRSA